MTITYPLTFPDLGIATITFRARHVVDVAQSPFTLTRQVQSFDAERWEADITLPRFDTAQAGKIQSFLLALRGPVGTFLLGDPLRTAPLGVATGTPLVRGAGQTGSTLNTKGWTANTTNILRSGDLIQLGTGTNARLHKLLNDVNSDASGFATLDLWPRLRTSPNDNAALTLLNCRGVFALNDATPEWAVDSNGFYTASLNAVEVI